MCCVPEVEENNWSTPRTDSPFVFDGFVWLEVVLLDAVLFVLLFGAVLNTTEPLVEAKLLLAPPIDAPIDFSVKLIVVLPAGK